MMKLINILKCIVAICMLHASPQAWSTCWALAEHTYGIDAKLLKAIAQVESGMNVVAVNKNANGTYDIGLMQINSTHFSRLSGLGVTEIMLKNDPCVSLLTGASILSDLINKYGYGWEAVGAYNAGTLKKRKRLRQDYAIRVAKTYRDFNGISPW